MGDENKNRTSPNAMLYRVKGRGFLFSFRKYYKEFLRPLEDFNWYFLEVIHLFDFLILRFRSIGSPLSYRNLFIIKKPQHGRSSKQMSSSFVAFNKWD